MAKAKQKHILSASEVAALEDEKHEIDSTLNAMEKEQYGHGTHVGSTVDRGAMKRAKAHVDKLIHDGTPGKIAPATKDKLNKRATELEGVFTKGMPTRAEMWAKRGEHPGIVRKQMAWEKRNAGAVQEWKQIQRRLEPEDPTASNIERLRKQQ